ncbi:DUF167 domain-containing protein [candidate division WOR-3 bacterium]|nr:DUF167 domain-containing protein [candidate division WOR-3 bacterium]
MRIIVKVIPRARKREIKKQPDGSYKIKVVLPPVNGKANKEVIDIVAKEFGIRTLKVRILRGEKTREKLIEIDKEGT